MTVYTGSTTKPPRRSERFRSLPRWQRTIIILGVLAIITSLIGVGGAWGFVHRYESQVKHEDILGVEAPAPEVEQHWEAGPLNLLLLGSDSREGERDEGRFTGERSDTIMLVHIAASRDRAAIISIPRDSYVHIPAGKNWKGGMNKLNAAFSYGGAPLAAKTISDLTGVTFDGAMIANFAGIRRMVDAVDGVNVCVPYDVKSTFSDKSWPKGCHRFDGANAEEFMRQRKNVPGGDFGRMHDQQLVVQGIIEKVSADGALNNPVKLDKLVMTAAQSLTIDKNLDLRQLASTVRNIKPANVKFATVPYSNPGLKTPVGSAVQLDDLKSKAMFDAIRTDTLDQWLAANPPKKPSR